MPTSEHKGMNSAVKLNLRKTKFTSAQFTYRATYYNFNKIYKNWNIYKKLLYEVEKHVTKWLEHKTYNDIEGIQKQKDSVFYVSTHIV